MPGKPGMIYLDNNATTRPLPEVIEAMSRHARDSYGNPGSRHAAGRVARQALEDARESISEILGAEPGEVIFTSGGTESINLAIFGLAASSSGVIALTAGEHPATLESCRRLGERGWSLVNMDVDSQGRLVPDKLETLPWGTGLGLVTLILAHNETGVIQDVTLLADLCRRHGAAFHLDAVQAVGKIPVNFHELGATTLVLGAHKFHGPRGIGALLVRQGTTLAPFQFGGHQESQRRPGTECVALAVGMATALRLWYTNRGQRTAQIRALRDRLQSGLIETCRPVVVNGSLDHRLPNTLNIAFAGLDGETLLVNFDLENVCCSLGSTCASGSADPAPSLVAMGCPPEIYASSVRFSVGIENTTGEIDEAVTRISAVVRRLRQDSGKR